MFILLLLGLMGPRVGTIVLWLFTDRISDAYDGAVVPVLGFFFLPWTTFLYALVQGGRGEVGTLGMTALAIGFIVDAVTLASAAAQRRRQVVTV